MFDWDEGNLDHIAEHGVHPDEAEEALRDPARLPAPTYRVGRERRRGVLGATVAGRLLFVVVTRCGPRLQVVTARDASPREKQRYRRSGG